MSPRVAWWSWLWEGRRGRWYIRCRPVVQLSRNKQRNRRARDDIIAKGSPRLMRLLEGFGTIDETVAALERICALV